MSNDYGESDVTPTESENTEIYLVPTNAGNDFQTSIGSPPIRIPRLAAVWSNLLPGRGYTTELASVGS